MVQPFYCYIGITLSFIVSLWLFATNQLDAQTYFYAPLGFLIAYFTLVAIIQDKQTYTPRSLREVVPKAVGKYLMWGGVVWGI